MRRVNKAVIPTPPALLHADCVTDLALIIADPAHTEAKDTIYRGIVQLASGKKIATVAIALKDLYNNKCAYCEKLCYDPEVEHFRPKNRVRSANPNPHGYYWLCYEWTNLLPSCHDCNSVTAKGDRFPITGGRVMTHPVTNMPPVYDNTHNNFDSLLLSAEQPLYIHPEYCPDFSFYFDFLRTGEIFGVSPEGIRTVTELKLNSQTLNGMRREIYNNYFERLKKIVLKFTSGAKDENWFSEEIYEFVSEIVKGKMDHEATFTLFRKNMLDRMDYYFVEPFDTVFQNDMRDKIAESLLHIAGH